MGKASLISLGFKSGLGSWDPEGIPCSPHMWSLFGRWPHSLSTLAQPLWGDYHPRESQWGAVSVLRRKQGLQLCCPSPRARSFTARPCKGEVCFLSFKSTFLQEGSICLLILQIPHSASVYLDRLVSLRLEDYEVLAVIFKINLLVLTSLNFILTTFLYFSRC